MLTCKMTQKIFHVCWQNCGKAMTPYLVGAYTEKINCQKKITSLIANQFRRWLTGEKIHDVNCMLKVYRKECFKDFTFYGDIHRYIPTVLALKGFKIGEIPVNHRPRYSGKTKYGFSRIFKGFFDLLFIKFWNDFSTRPIHFFGAISITQFLLAGILLVEQFVKADLVGEFKFGPVLMLSVLLLTRIPHIYTWILGRNDYQDLRT